MSTASRHLCRSLIRLSSRPPTRRKCRPLPRQVVQTAASPYRQLSTSCHRLADNKPRETQADNTLDFDESELLVPSKPYTVADLDPTARAHYETLSKEAQSKYLAVQNHIKALTESEEFATLSEDDARRAAREIERAGLNQGINLSMERNLAALREGFWQDSEDDEFGQVPDEDDEVTEDMVTSVAESELEVHREVREYTRIAAWDLPLLLQFTKPFERPDGTKLPLRFRYTTYMGESHPAQRKVVVEFNMRNMAKAAGLTKEQTLKLKKLVGVRYNPETGMVKISCEKYENAAQNKRYLGDMVQKLIKETKEGKDNFADIPVDYRHHKFKKRIAFPTDWLFTGEGDVAALREARKQPQLLEDGRKAGTASDEEENVVDGAELLEMYVASKSIQPSLARPR